jgi:hypothetical protein
MKKVFISFALVAVAIICGAWTRANLREAAENPVSKNYFQRPDKMMIYKDGKTQILTENDKLFSDIFTNMNGRVTNPGNLGMVELAFPIQEMEAMKKSQIVVEFIYTKTQKITVYSEKREVYGLIFPLTGKHFDLCFLERNLNHYGGPVGSLDNVGDVLQLLK